MYHVGRDGDSLTMSSFSHLEYGGGWGRVMRSVASTALGTPVAGLFFFTVENVSLPYLCIIAISMVILKFPLPEDLVKDAIQKGILHFSLYFSPQSLVCVFVHLLIPSHVSTCVRTQGGVILLEYRR